MMDRPSRQRDPLPTRVDSLPPLPDAYADALDRGLAELPLTLDPAAREAIDGHVRLLLAWNAAINLTSIRDPIAVARRHVLDSLAAVALLRGRRTQDLLDLGSGGGYPGLPLAAALTEIPVLLVESVAKKAAFLRTVTAATGLAGRVAVGGLRAEALADDPRMRERRSAIVARAVGRLADLVELAFPLLEPGGTLVAWKRGDLAGEMPAAVRAMRALGGGEMRVHPVHVTALPGHVLVEVRKAGRTPPGYPRDPARRARRPW